MTDELPELSAPPSVRGIEAALRVLGGKWKLLILWHLAAEPRHYGALRRLIPPVSHKVLTEQLRQLERDGLVAREVRPANPPRTVYSLTAYAKSLYPLLAALCEWGRSHLEREGPPRGEAGSGPAPPTQGKAPPDRAQKPTPVPAVPVTESAVPAAGSKEVEGGLRCAKS